MTSAKDNDLIVIGGGMTGLSIAYIAARSGLKVTLLEASSKVGGLLNTFRVGNGYLECFYHHFFTHDMELRWLLEELNLMDKLVYRHTKMGIYCDGHVYPFSTSKDLLNFPPISSLDKLRFAASSFYLGKSADWRTCESTSALEWLRKWAGTKATEKIWEPLFRTKFGCHAHNIPLSWLVGRLQQRVRSRERGKEQLAYLKGSLKVLLDALLQKLQELHVDVQVNTSVGGLITDSNKSLSVQTNSGVFYGKKAVLTIPSPPIAEIVKTHSKELSRRLSKIDYLGAVCVILELKEKLSAIYWLNISDPELPFGVVIEQTNFTKAEDYGNKHIVYLSKYFTHDEAFSTLSEAQMKDIMIESLSKVHPHFDRSGIINAHVFRTNTAATVCDLNFSEKIVNAKLPINRLYLANMMHIYPDERSVNNSIRVAAEACRVMDISSDFVYKGSSLAGQIGFG